MIQRKEQMQLKTWYADPPHPAAAVAKCAAGLAIIALIASIGVYAPMQDTVDADAQQPMRPALVTSSQAVGPVATTISDVVAESVTEEMEAPAPATVSALSDERDR